MLALYNTKRAQAKAVQNTPAHQAEYERALAEFADQIYSKAATNVNAAFKTHPELKDVKDRTLTGKMLLEGERLKGHLPQHFTKTIIASVDTEPTKLTAYGEAYSRYCIQPNWVTGNLVVVKEEIHFDAIQQRVFFFGRPVDKDIARQVLIPALIDELSQGTPNATKAFAHLPKGENLKQYLENNFDALFLSETPPLFHVTHGISGEEDSPFETWELVRLERSQPQLKEAYQALRERIASSVSTRLYEQTINHFDEKKRNGLAL
ncbi:MAG: hypothetical protein JSR17_03580 [Proteobacteria bacterium]|nr:hypothetical protein [Pseudomonadota bacterium]